MDDRTRQKAARLGFMYGYGATAAAQRLKAMGVINMLTKEQLAAAIGATTAPKVTDADLDAAISEIEYFYTGTLTLCVMHLANGFTTVGQSACVSPENYNKDIGDKIAYDNARRQIWQLEGYALADRIYHGSVRFIAETDGPGGEPVANEALAKALDANSGEVAAADAPKPIV